MLLVLLSAVIAVALPSSSDGFKLMDLQELHLTVSDNLRELGQDIKDLIKNVNSNADRSEAIAKHAEEIANANAKMLNESMNRVGETLKLIIVNAKLNADNVNTNARVNAKQVNESLQENADVLEHILGALDKMGSANNESLERELSNTKDTLETTRYPFQGRDCADLYQQGERSSGVYFIKTPGMEDSFSILCDMRTDGGGWTVFQKRGTYGNPSDYFARTWIEYKNGFGELEKEFWIGNDHLSALTQQNDYVLRVDLWDMVGNHAYAKYDTFRVGNEKDLYRLSLDGYSGSAGDSMNGVENLNKMAFTTKDKDNDLYPYDNCASGVNSGGWWYNQCSDSNLNGLNLPGTAYTAKRIFWFYWKHSSEPMESTEMKIRPVVF